MKPLLLLLLFITVTASAADIRVLVWDEQQPEQKKAYGEKFLGETIAAHLEKMPGLVVKTARLDDFDQGLSDATLDATDVLVFWSHRRAKEQNDARMETVVQRVLAGRLALIAPAFRALGQALCPPHAGALQGRCPGAAPRSAARCRQVGVCE